MAKKNNNIQELHHDYEQDYKNYPVYETECEDSIYLQRWSLYIRKQDTNMRQSITAETRLQATSRIFSSSSHQAPTGDLLICHQKCIW